MSTPYITSLERRGIERGIEQGIEQGIERGRAEERALLLRLSRRRFGTTYEAQLSALLERVNDSEALAAIGEWILDCADGQALLQRVQAVLAESS